MRAAKSSSADNALISQTEPQSATAQAVDRALMVSHRFHDVYTPCWEGAYGAIGDAYLYAATKDASLLKFHLVDHNLLNMCAGRGVDDPRVGLSCRIHMVEFHRPYQQAADR